MAFCHITTDPTYHVLPWLDYIILWYIHVLYHVVQKVRLLVATICTLKVCGTHALLSRVKNVARDWPALVYSGTWLVDDHSNKPPCFFFYKSTRNEATLQTFMHRKIRDLIWSADIFQHYLPSAQCRTFLGTYKVCSEQFVEPLAVVGKASIRRHFIG